MAVSRSRLLLSFLALSLYALAEAEPRILTYTSNSVYVEATDSEGAEAHTLAEAQCQKGGLHAYNTGRPDGPKGTYLFFGCADEPRWQVEVSGRVLTIRAPQSAVAEVTRVALEECVKRGATSARLPKPPTDAFPAYIFLCSE